MKIQSMSQVADHVRSQLDLLATTHLDDDAFPAKLPPGDGLQTLLEEAFWASISRDEGRQCRFTVAYYGDEGARDHPDVAIALDPQRFERGILRRLAAVAFAADAEIAVSLVSGDLRIIGLCKHFDAYLSWAGVPDLPHKRTMPVEVEVRGPGRMLVRYGTFRVLTYVDGHIPPPRPNVLDMEGPFRDALNDLATVEGVSPTIVRLHLSGLLQNLDRRGHGGLVILSATEPNGLDSKSWGITGRVLGLLEVENLRADGSRRCRLPHRDPNWVSSAQLGETQRALWALSADILKLSTALALTDGAVWLDGSLRPRAFGIFARFETNQQVSSATDAAGTELQAMAFATLGARHRALVALAGHNPECPTIAISVDGGFAAALQSRDRDKVVVWHFESWDL